MTRSNSSLSQKISKRQRDMKPPTDGSAVHWLADDGKVLLVRERGPQVDNPLLPEEILCWKITGVEPARDEQYRVIWNTTDEGYLTCRECLELKHA